LSEPDLIDIRYAIRPADGGDTDPSPPPGATADDLAAARGLAPRRRWGFVAGRAILRTMAADRSGRPVHGPFARRCPNCGSDQHGPPVVASGHLHASITRTDGFVAVALAAVPIGIDAEACTAVPLVADVFSPAERARLAGGDERSMVLATEAWALKEAVGKLTGLGLLGAAATEVGPLPPTEEWVAGVDACGARCFVRRLAVSGAVEMVVALAARRPAPVATARAMAPAAEPAVELALV
jgi:hypothetical protein